MFALDVFFWLVAVFYAWTSLRMIREVVGIRRLPPLESSEDEVRVTAVVPVRDGVGQIAGTIETLLAQTGVRLDVIVVDDRSEDGTAELIDRIAADEERVTALHVAALPDRWLGKCHALHVGSEAATGDWILLADADVRLLESDVVARALQIALGERAQHVSAIFRPTDPSPLGEACCLNFGLAAFNADYGGVNRDRPGSFGGIGAFNLVETRAFRDVGGYEPLRLTVCDDSRIGKLLNAHGHRTRLFVDAAVGADWGTTVFQNVKLLEKNLFAAAEYHVPFAVFVSFQFVLVPWLGAVAGAIAAVCCGSIAGAAAALAAYSSAIPAWLLAAKCGGRRWTALLGPFLWPVLGVTMLNSVWVTLRQGGVRWRDTFYPLDVLREGTYV